MLEPELSSSSLVMLDYLEGLSKIGHQVSVITSPQAAINSSLSYIKNISHLILRQSAICKKLKITDPFLPRRLQSACRLLRAEIIIVHGAESLGISQRTFKNIPLILVAHAPNLPDLTNVKAIFVSTRALLSKILNEKNIADKIPPEQVFFSPRMVSMHGGFVRASRRTTPIIGAVFPAQKDAKEEDTRDDEEEFIRALGFLRDKGLQFQILIASQDSNRMRRMARPFHLEENIIWEDKLTNFNEFFDKIDLLCLCGSFGGSGVVLLEAMAEKLPILAVGGETIDDFARHGENCLRLGYMEATALADALTWLLENETKARDMGKEAHNFVRNNFEMKLQSQQITKILEQFAIKQ